MGTRVKFTIPYELEPGRVNLAKDAEIRLPPNAVILERRDNEVLIEMDLEDLLPKGFTERDVNGADDSG